MAKSLMILGTASNVGKSLLCTALCRIFAQDGFRVAPFKGQNMSLNSAVTPSGREIGRAQALQAAAAGILPNEHMNPVLLKPTGQMMSQVVLQGRPVATMSAREYFTGHKEELWLAVQESHAYLCARFDVVVMEGAGSPVEMNLKGRDITNLRAAEMADADVLLVADIDRGGVFAAVVGTLQLMTQTERARVKGIVVNRFRGDASLFTEGRDMLAAYAGVPVIGVIPYAENLLLDEEDSVGLQHERYQRKAGFSGEVVRIGVVPLPHMSNYTDVDPLFAEPDVDVFFAREPSALFDVDVIVIPGTKSTMLDMQWLHASGWSDVITAAAARGTWLVGICGGFQMLGASIRDPHHHEGNQDEVQGLGCFTYVTTIRDEKETRWVEGVLCGNYVGIPVQGYEIHMGYTEGIPEGQAFATVASDAAGAVYHDGVSARDGQWIGTYLHGIFHNDVFRHQWLTALAEQRGVMRRDFSHHAEYAQEDALNRWADIVRAHLDCDALYEMLQLSPQRASRRGDM